jgi:guanosine-3',5'-bis(diphosphate) 3'-pyrophosphohydrolase
MAHSVRVARILAEMRMDLVAMQTGLLHDVVEDTSVTVEQVRKEFGEEVARCVDGVTKLTKLDFFSAEDRQAESVRKMLLAMVEDIRVIMVKLADRIHNMRTLSYLNAERRQRIARETLEIYAPIAHRLGMGKVRGELEDLAFQYLEPDAYKEIAGAIETSRESNEEFLAEVRRTVEAELRREAIPARIDGRLKRPYSVFQKMRRQKILLDQVYDLTALRIVTDSVKNCYAALGVIHNEWRPIPGRIKDFIAIPRPNLYQSLHTRGRPARADVRGADPHRGDAPHRRGRHRRPLEIQRGPQGSGGRRSAHRLAAAPGGMAAGGAGPRRVHVHAEGGPVPRRGLHVHAPGQSDRAAARRHAHRLSPTPFTPTWATPCVGAKVNGRIVPLRSGLRNGDIVEIMTQPGHEPSKDWLAYVKTSRARNKIKHVINASERTEGHRHRPEIPGQRGAPPGRAAWQGR